jgi:colicin import membrane protein
MTAGRLVTRSERALSAALALAMHALFFALLVFGVAWQHQRESRTVVAELWASLPPPPQPEPVPAARIDPAPAREEPRPTPRAQPQPAVKPEIALREKQAQQREAREQALLEKKKRAEEQTHLAALKEEQAREAEAKRLAREQEEALRRLAEQKAREQARLVDEYKRRIGERIKRYIVEPPNLPGNPEVEFEVVLLPGGEVLGVKLKKPSAVAAWDSAVERAILRAQPLPLPPDPALFREFRELHLKFRPKE